MLDRIKQAADYLQSNLSFSPQYGLILGTGLNALADLIETPQIIPYEDVPHMPPSTAPSHQGRFVCGELAGKKVIIMQGRLHYYEGYSLAEVTFPVRLFQLLGCQNLIVTNAAGSLNEKLQPGTIVLIKDHLNLLGNNPLIGKNPAELGERFPSLNDAYSLRLRKLALEIARRYDFSLPEGVYAAVSGPSLETPAECLLLAKAGADLVGMSTVPEVIVAVQAGMEVLGLSIVTNLSNMFHALPHSQEEIRANAARAQSNLQKLIIEIIKRINK